MTAILALMLCAHALSAILVLPASLDGTISHPPFGYPYYNVRDYLGVTNSSFTTDLGTLDGITAELSVGTGNLVHVNLPAGKTGTFVVSLGYLGGGSYGASDVWSNNGGQFLGLAGTAPILNSLETRGRVQGNDVYIQAVYSFTDAFSFEGWRVDINSPFISGGSLTFTPTTSLFGFAYPDTVDDGQFVTISSAPEPSQACLCALVLGTLLATSRRRARPARRS